MTKVRFQLYYGALASNEAPEKTNEGALLYPTQALPRSFPSHPLSREQGGWPCHFEGLKGYCVAAATSLYVASDSASQ